MASITLCPRCTSHLELPTGVDPTLQVQCPICEVEFLLASVAPRIVPQVRIVERAPIAVADPAAEDCFFAKVAEVDANSPQEPLPDSLSRILRSTADWRPSAAAASSVSQIDDDDVGNFAVEEQTETSFDAAYQDADPELAAPIAATDMATDELRLSSSKLDQLLSDLIKSPTDAQPPKQFDDLHPRSIETVVPSFGMPQLDEEFVGDDCLQSPGAEFKAESHDWHPDEDQHSLTAEELAEADDPLPTFIGVAPRRKRRPARLRTLVGIVGGGVIGILGGAYALLLLRGADGDVIGMARWLPPAMLPISARQFVADDSSAPTTLQDGTDDDEANLDPIQETPSSPLLATENLIVEEPIDSEPTAGQNSEVTGVLAVPRYDSSVISASALEPAEEPNAEMAENDENDTTLITVTEVMAPPSPARPMLWPTTPVVGDLRDVPLYSIDDLSQALDGADAAHRQFLAGNLSRKEDVASMGKAYIKLCELAERFTLTNPAQYSNDLIAKQMAAKEVFRGTAGDPMRRNDLAIIAGRWLQHNRRQNQGVVLVGRVSDLRARGRWTDYTIEVPLGDASAQAAVLMDNVRFSAGDEITVVGAMVPNPREHVAGYDGNASQIVVAGFSFLPEDYKAPAAGETSDLFSLDPEPASDARN